MEMLYAQLAPPDGYPSQMASDAGLYWSDLSMLMAQQSQRCLFEI